ncbi:unnamed protein product, partial [Didymodactylos carnosus]
MGYRRGVRITWPTITLPTPLCRHVHFAD